MNNLFLRGSKQAGEIGGRETGLQGKLGTVRAPGSFCVNQCHTTNKHLRDYSVRIYFFNREQLLLRQWSFPTADASNHFRSRRSCFLRIDVSGHL